MYCMRMLNNLICLVIDCGLRLKGVSSFVLSTLIVLFERLFPALYWGVGTAVKLTVVSGNILDLLDWNLVG